MKETKTLFFMLGILFAVCACSKNDSEKAQQTDPLFGFWCDSDRNYMLGIHSDSIGFMIDEMDGIHINVTHSTRDFDAWMKGDFSTATALDEPFEITLVDAIVFPYVRTKRRVFNQMQI